MSFIDANVELCYKILVDINCDSNYKELCVFCTRDLSQAEYDEALRNFPSGKYTYNALDAAVYDNLIMPGFMDLVSYGKVNSAISKVDKDCLFKVELKDNSSGK